MPADPTTEVAESTNQLLSTDFEIGHYIRERVVPFAVLLFTGEGLDDEEEYEEEEEEEEVIHLHWIFIIVSSSY